MKKKISLLIIYIITAALSYIIDWFNYILILIIAVTLLHLIFIGLISIFKKLNNRNFKIPLIIISICVIGIVISFFRPYDEPIIKTKNLSNKLKYAYKTDQSDRKELRSFISIISKLEERDSIRLKQVKNLYLQDKILDPIDKFHAAFIFHHSDFVDDYKIASKLASDAADNTNLKDNYTVQWLKKASYDRYMISIGKPEKYNTQNKFSIELE